MVEKTSFGEDEVRVLLESEELWPQLLKLDPSRLKQIITDEKLAREIKSKLEALRWVVTSHPQLWVKRLTHEE
jgi:hypothetical protein